MKKLLFVACITLPCLAYARSGSESMVVIGHNGEEEKRVVAAPRQPVAEETVHGAHQHGSLLATLGEPSQGRTFAPADSGVRSQLRELGRSVAGFVMGCLCMSAPSGGHESGSTEG